MDEDLKAMLIKRVLEEILPPPMNMEIQDDISKAETLEEVIKNHKISLTGKEFIIVADSAEDATQAVTVIQMDKHNLRDLISRLIRSYKMIEAKEKQDVQAG